MGDDTAGLSSSQERDPKPSKLPECEVKTSKVEPEASVGLDVPFNDTIYWHEELVMELYKHV